MKKIIMKSLVSILCMISIDSIGDIVKSNIGLRNILCQDIPQEYVPASTYVQDGLIAMWDAIENVGWGMHDSNATIWKDLIGSNDLLCPSKSNGYFSRDGWHQIVAGDTVWLMPTSISPCRFLDGATVFTMEACWEEHYNRWGGSAFNSIDGTSGIDYSGFQFFSYIRTVGGNREFRTRFADGVNYTNSSFFGGVDPYSRFTVAIVFSYPYFDGFVNG